MRGGKLWQSGAFLLLCALGIWLSYQNEGDVFPSGYFGIDRFWRLEEEAEPAGTDGTENDGEADYIRWVEFNVSLAALEQAYQYDISTYGEAVHLDWVSLLAYAATHTGGDFSGESKVKALIREGAEKLLSGEASVESFLEQYEYYNYYYEAYGAVLGGWLGTYEYQEEENGEIVWKSKYGLKAYSPVARYFYYEDYDDFGASRSYGYARRHLGHDMLGQTGTPIIAVESGVVEAMGWNQYGGWRIGIRSFDGKRYYYYAHLRKDFPYVKTLQIGDTVTAGDVIGYMGRTGYSTEENVNNIEVTHLHFGLELIFDESQKESNNEIWIDCYALTQFLTKHKSETVKNTETKEWYRIYEMIDPAEEAYLQEREGQNAVAVP